jgi:type III pantothenate kinase
MLLAIDIGNTQTVLGLFSDGTDLHDTWRLASDITRTPDDLYVTLVNLFATAPTQEPTIISQVIIASVVPALTGIWTELAQRLADTEALIVSTFLTGGVALRVVNPAEVGADRIANAAAARALYGTPAVVLDFGTATNIDVIDTDGAYIGGVISPGVETSAQALFKSAARLPAIDLEPPPQILGTTTKTAVQSGLLYGEAAKMDALLACLKLELPQLDAPDVPIIATGGLAKLIAPLIPLVTHQDEYLTLRGLALIAETQRS